MQKIARALSVWKKKDISQAYKRAKRICSFVFFDLRIIPTKHPHGKILISVPKKVGNAPTRNKIRRQIKSIFYENKLYTKGFDWLFFIKKDATKLSFQELQKLVCTTCLERLPSFSSPQSN